MVARGQAEAQRVGFEEDEVSIWEVEDALEVDGAYAQRYLNGQVADTYILCKQLKTRYPQREVATANPGRDLSLGAPWAAQERKYPSPGTAISGGTSVTRGHMGPARSILAPQPHSLT